jgi:2-C-methyl-D-erythritol 4-phosphate cytidylyltransferase
MKGSVIITAGGIGKRMGGKMPKQFLALNGKPILLHTLENFHAFDQNLEFILTLPMDWVPYWQEQLETFGSRIPHQLIAGGKERFDSIKHALPFCSGDFIAVHDGVRPFVSHDTIRRCFDALKESKSVVPVLAVKDSLRMIQGGTSQLVNRDDFKMVHTPQCFDAETLKKAYNVSFHHSMTDDASVVEQFGISPRLVESNEENIKITTQADLTIARALFS